MPITALGGLPDAAQWWHRLGVADPDELPTVGAGEPPRLYATTPGTVSALVRVVVDVASYIGWASLAGVIGARADAALSAVLKLLRRPPSDHPKRQAGLLFREVHDRWQRRAIQINDPLSESEAIAAAKAAVLTQGYSLADLTISGTQQGPDGTWRVVLTAAGAFYTRSCLEGTRLAPKS